MKLFNKLVRCFSFIKKGFLKRHFIDKLLWNKYLYVHDLLPINSSIFSLSPRIICMPHCISVVKSSYCRHGTTINPGNFFFSEIPKKKRNLETPSPRQKLNMNKNESQECLVSLGKRNFVVLKIHQTEWFAIFVQRSHYLLTKLVRYLLVRLVIE